MRLKALKLYSLERRRERYTVLYMWKIIRGLVPNPGISTRWNPDDRDAHQSPDRGRIVPYTEAKKRECLLPRPKTI
jgi:hypothetical protein